MTNAWTAVAVASAFIVGGSIASAVIARLGTLNPLTLLWGPKLIQQELHKKDELLIDVKGYPDDEYLVKVELTHVFRSRNRGPKWARRPSKGYAMVGCAVKDGVPVSNKGYIRKIYYGEFPVKDTVYWRMEAVIKFVDHIQLTRQLNDFKPPSNVVFLNQWQKTQREDVLDDDLENDDPLFLSGRLSSGRRLPPDPGDSLA